MSLLLKSTLSLLLMLTISGCAAPLPASFRPQAENHSLLERLEHADSSNALDAEGANEHNADSSLSNDALLAEIDVVLVETMIESQPFQTLARTSHITQYPCSSCHIEPLADLQADPGLTAPKAHWDIEIAHADESIMTCTTCHSPDEMDTLHTLSGNSVSFDHSYQVCAQCHSGIAEDWVGGAHGKRVGGWTPPRVVNNCVDCHNPHQPQWETRWPAVTNGSSTEQ